MSATLARPGFHARLDQCYRSNGGPLVWLGNFEVEQVWARSATSLPRVSSREGSALVSRLDEFALWLARSGDTVLLKGASDPGFTDYVGSITGWSPRLLSLDAPDHDGLVSEVALLVADEGRLPSLPADAGVVAHGFSGVERELAERAGLTWVAPGVDDVVRVNSKIYSRQLADELGIGQPRGTTCEWLEDWDRALNVARHLLKFGPIVLKEALGVSGKGISVVDSSSRLDRIAKRVVQAAQRNDGRVGFTIEQWVAKDRDFNYQFTIDRDGRTTFDSVKQILTRNGVHLGHYIPAELSGSQLAEIRAVSAAVGRRLHRDGYWGVVGVDALTEVDGTLHPLIEINARFNMSTYQLPVQDAFGAVAEVALAKHYEVRTAAAIPFERVRAALGDLLLEPGGTSGIVVLNHATVNAAAAVAPAGTAWVGRIYGLLCAPDRAALDDLDRAVTGALAVCSGDRSVGGAA